MKIRYIPGISYVELHCNIDKEPMASLGLICFRFSYRFKSQHTLKVSPASWEYTVVELKHITTKPTNQSRVMTVSLIYYVCNEPTHFSASGDGQLRKYVRHIIVINCLAYSWLIFVLLDHEQRNKSALNLRQPAK